jgi:hypothetical protein
MSSLEDNKAMTSQIILVVTLVAVALVVPAVSYPEYIAELPSHPHDARGVGHVSPGGGGLRNQFGEVSAISAKTRSSPPLNALPQHKLSLLSKQYLFFVAEAAARGVTNAV